MILPWAIAFGALVATLDVPEGVEVVSPAQTIELPVAEFTDWYGKLLLAPDGRTVFYTESTEAIDVYALLFETWPSWIGEIVVLLELLLLWRLVRRWRHPREPGEPYCRKCNYQLTGIEAESCPECGSLLSKRTITIGRPNRGRVVATVAMMLILAGSYLGAWLTEEGYRLVDRVFYNRFTLCSPRLATLSERYGIEWLDGYAVLLTELRTIDLEGDAGQVLLPMDKNFINCWRSTPDERYLLIVEIDKQVIVQWDIANRRVVRRVPIFAEDIESSLDCRQLHISVPDDHGYTKDVTLDLETGQIGARSWDTNPGPGHNFTRAGPQGRYAVGTTLSAKKPIITLDGKKAGEINDWTGEMNKVTFTRRGNQMFNWSSGEPDRNRIDRWTIPQGRRLDPVRFPKGIMLLKMVCDREDRWLFVELYDHPEAMIAVIDLRSGRWIATLKPPPGIWYDEEQMAVTMDNRGLVLSALRESDRKPLALRYDIRRWTAPPGAAHPPEAVH